jgi:hypothetical protein
LLLARSEHVSLSAISHQSEEIAEHVHLA